MAGPDRLTELAAILDRRLELPAGPLIVGLSGGADSAALLWLVARRSIDVTAVHVFHNLPASSVMSAAAGQVAAFCGVRLEMAFVDPAGQAEHHLRDVRHAALRAQAGERPILLAHTRDDQAETVLMRILRGTGPDGLSGIRQMWDGIHHPILGITRAEARELAQLAGLPFRDDPANDDPSILRNQLRSAVLPAIEEAIGRSPREALVRLAESARDESEVLDELAARIPVHHLSDAVRIPLGSLLAVGDVVAGRAIRRAVTAVGGPYPPDRDALRRILDVVHGRSTAAQLEPGRRVEVREGHLVIFQPSNPATLGSQGDSVPLGTQGMGTDPAGPVPVSEGTTRWGGWVIEREEVDGPTATPLSAARLLAPIESGPWEVRAVRADDRVTGRSAVAALRDAGVRAEERGTWPVVTCDGEPVWLPRVRRRVWPAYRPGRYLGFVASQEPNWQTFAP